MRRIKPFLALLIMTVSLACASVRSDAFTFPDVSNIATPDKADDVLYAGTLGYQFVVGSINALHEAKKFSDDRYERLIMAEDAPARRVRDALKNGFAIVETWRASGDRTPFDAFYPKLTVPYAELRRALAGGVPWK